MSMINLVLPRRGGVYQCLAYNGQYVLYYIDYATHQKVALCNRPECRHNDNTCAAWMPNHALPFVIGDKLYLWCMPEWTEDGPGPYFIQKRNLDGSEPEILWETDTGESIVTGLAANDEYFYFFTYQMSEGLEDVESATYWNRVKISDG